MFENMITIPSSIVNMIEGGMYDHLKSMRIFIEIISKRLYELQTLRRKCLQPWFGFANHLVPNACFHILGDVDWLEKRNYLRPIYLKLIKVFDAILYSTPLEKLFLSGYTMIYCNFT